MIKRTLLAAAAAMVMCNVVVAQDGTYFDNVNKNMQPPQNKVDKMQDKGMQATSSYGMKTYDDLNNWSDNSSWMKDVWVSMNARDQAALQQALWRLPSAEEKAVRKALQKCHVGGDAMHTKMREYNSMATQAGTTEKKFMMSDEAIWNNTLDGLTTYERRQLGWVYENMSGGERIALQNALRACHEHHWRMSTSVSSY